VQLQISGLDCADAAPRLCRFSGVAQIRRSDFGLPHGFFAGGDKVEISVNGVGLQ
jgi:polyisoprenoid-binding protein YceI